MTKEPVYFNITGYSKEEAIFNNFVNTLVINWELEDNPNTNDYFNVIKTELKTYNAVYRHKGCYRRHFIRFATASYMTMFVLKYS
jgi:hypothetical protein